MTASTTGVHVSNMPVPMLGPPLTLTGPPVPPAHRIYFYSSDEWEEFIKEWAQGLPETYVQIKQLGGTGDQGIDVAAFKTDRGLEGPWDCYQGKHYSRDLRPADAWAEILKVFIHVEAADYVLPDSYAFLAPKGCGGTLNRWLSSPSKLRAEFLSAFDAGGVLVRELDGEVKKRVRDIAAVTDFSIFKSVELHEALEVHARTKFHMVRFGAMHLTRTEIGAPPDALASHETNYIAELRKVYSERCGAEISEDESLTEHPKFATHFKRQRFSFYSAEALRMDVRDAVPDGTFERLQDDVYAGIVETVETQHASGMDRLSASLTHATLLDLSAHPLVSLARPDDRKGICHQLANDFRLAWIPDAE